MYTFVQVRESTLACAVHMGVLYLMYSMHIIILYTRVGTI